MCACVFLFPTASLLEPLKDTLQAAAEAELHLTVRAKGQEQQQLAAMLEAIKAVGSPRVGTLPKEQHTGQLTEMWGQQLADSGLTTCDATAGGSGWPGWGCSLYFAGFDTIDTSSSCGMNSGPIVAV